MTGGGGGGGVGGVRPSPGPGSTDPGEETPRPKIEVFPDGSSATIQLSGIPENGQVDIDPDGAISGEPFAVSRIWMNFRSDVGDFSIETTSPRVDSRTSPSLPSDAGTPVGYLDLEIIGIEDTRVAETRMRFSVSENTLPAESSLDDLTVYQRIDGEWVALDTDTEGGDLIATLETTSEEHLAVGSDMDGKSDSTETADNGDAESQAESDDQSGIEIPGFGVSVTILALLSVAALLRRL